MALDTRDKRSSAILLTLPFRAQLPSPGTLDQGDRQQVAGLYRGILADEDLTPEAYGDLTTLFAGYLDTLKDANVDALDVQTLLRADEATVLAGSNSPDDRNTAYAEFLS